MWFGVGVGVYEWILPPGVIGVGVEEVFGL